MVDAEGMVMLFASLCCILCLAHIRGRGRGRGVYDSNGVADGEDGQEHVIGEGGHL
jgi:hypothetical protein